MTYHTNHCWCSESNWNNKEFDGEVMVYFEEHLENDLIKYEHKIENPDFENLTITEEFFDEQKYLSIWNKSLKEDTIEMKQKKLGRSLSDDEIEELKQNYLNTEKNYSFERTITLKPEVIDWLNENIQDKKNTNENTPLEDRKGWAIGSPSYNSRQSYQIKVFFERQADALKFIRKFSIFKDPTFYFDYFNDERGNLSTNKIFDILEEHNIKVDRENFVSSSRDDVTYIYDEFKDIIMNLRLLDWDKNSEDISYTKEDLENLIKDLEEFDSNETLDMDRF